MKIQGKLIGTLKTSVKHDALIDRNIEIYEIDGKQINFYHFNSGTLGGWHNIRNLISIHGKTNDLTFKSLIDVVKDINSTYHYDNVTWKGHIYNMKVII
ncbi:MAG: hypothetical protein IKT40_12345 [Bacilli bacterium]|nr:hypothetical protein [Bacilli bacterium]